MAGEGQGAPLVQHFEMAVDLHYRAHTPCTLLTHIEPAHTNALVVKQSVIELTANYDDQPGFFRAAGLDNIGSRQWFTVADEFHINLSAQVSVTREKSHWDGLAQDRLETLPGEVATYLFPSRYCPIEGPDQIAWHNFGDLQGGPLIETMADWIAKNIRYDNGVSTSQTTAVDTLATRAGVCRDFAHVLIAMARARSIPARMVASFSPHVKPQDFHAIAQVWLDGAWHLVDPTGMSRADNTIILAVGRDATDIAFMTAFGMVTMLEQSVRVEPL
ncbi:MAG: transglutaminase family protein [Pseudomonadota bacterium]